jgi:hypothetical protein
MPYYTMKECQSKVSNMLFSQMERGSQGVESETKKLAADRAMQSQRLIPSSPDQILGCFIVQVWCSVAQGEGRP